MFNATTSDSEWALCNALGKSKCRDTLEDHWSTFYTIQDFAEIKAAGLSMTALTRFSMIEADQIQMP